MPAREASVAAARKRDAGSKDGKRDHAKRQRRYVERRQQKVTDQRGREVDAQATLSVPPASPPPLEVTDATRGEGVADVVGAAKPAGFMHCAFCGRTGRFVRRTFLRRRWGRARTG